MHRSLRLLRDTAASIAAANATGTRGWTAPTMLDSLTCLIGTWPGSTNEFLCGLAPELSRAAKRRRLGRIVMTHVSALFVQPDGCYAGLPEIDTWPEQRDARKYRGPWPVVAHPPCQLWGAFAPINYKRWGGEHNRPGNDGGCFAAALESVRRFGGVLEHPAKTNKSKPHAVWLFWPKPKNRH